MVKPDSLKLFALTGDSLNLFKMEYNSLFLDKKKNNPEFFLRTIKRSKKIKFNGTIQTEGVFSNMSQPLQAIPYNYVRFILRGDIKIGLIPLKLHSIVSTEHQGRYNPINIVGLSFNQNEFRSALKQKIVQEIKSESNRKNKSLQNLPLEMKLDDRIAYLNSIKTPDTLTSRNKNLISDSIPSKLSLGTQHIPDSNYALSYEYDSLIKVKETLVQIRIKNDIEVNKEIYSLDNDRKFRSLLREKGYNSPLYKLLFSLDNFELGNCTPEFGKLALTNTLLTGINIQLNLSKWYVGAAAGSLVSQNRIDVLQNVIKNTPTFAVKTGIGNPEKSFLGIQYVKFDGHEAMINDTFLDNGNISTLTDNKILGFSAQFWVNRDFKVYAEVNTSNNTTFSGRSEIKNSNVRISNLKDIFTGEANRNAILTYASYNFRLIKSKIFFEFRRIDPYYFSAGMPFLRRDNQRYEFRYTQILLKNKAEVSISSRKDADNLSRQKISTTYIQTNSLSLNLKPVSFYLINAAISKCKQLTKFNLSELESDFSVVSISNLFNYRIVRRPASTTLTYYQQSITLDYDKNNTHLQQVSIDQTINLLGHTNLVSMTRILSSINNLKDDTADLLELSQNLSLDIYKKTTLKIGYIFTKDRFITGRHSYSTCVKYSTNKLGTLECSYIFNEWRYNSSFTSENTLRKQNRFLITYTISL